MVDPGMGAGTTPTIGTSVVRSGTYAGVCASGAGNIQSFWNWQTGWCLTLNATNYVRCYFCFAGLPSAATADIVVPAASNTVAARLTSAGKLQLWNYFTAGQIGSDSVVTIVADSSTWYRIEMSVTLNASTQITACEVRLDGVSVASTTGLAIGSSQVCALGWRTAPGANKTCYIDDIAINDSTGSAQNTWPGAGSVVLLVPTADSAVGTGWTLGTGTAIASNSGSTAVKNRPPLGVADLTAGSDAWQIRNATSNANVNYDATMTTYTAAGVAAGATVNVITPIVATAAPVSTSAKAGTVGVVSNPAITNVALSTEGTAGAFWQGFAAAAYKSGWKWSYGTPTSAPSVTLGTAPVMRVTQVTASTRIAQVCFMGIHVDYTPAAAPTVTKKPRVLSSRVAAFRAALR